MIRNKNHLRNQHKSLRRNLKRRKMRLKRKKKAKNRSSFFSLLREGENRVRHDVAPGCLFGGY